MKWKLLSPILMSFGASYIQYYCPGCEEMHGVPINTGEAGRDWKFNGNYEKPSITPSVRHFHYTDPPKNDTQQTDCHYFITDGNIAYCGDCVHKCNGQTLPLPPIPARYIPEDNMADEEKQADETVDQKPASETVEQPVVEAAVEETTALPPMTNEELTIALRAAHARLDVLEARVKHLAGV